MRVIAMPGSFSPTEPPRLPVVLVVDDEDAVRNLLFVGLRQHGFEVWVAANGREALALYGRQPGAVSFVLIDVQMPDLDGPGVLAALRDVDPGVRAYFMTGDPGRYTPGDLLAAGAGRVFDKPLELAAVAAELHQCLAATGATTRPALPAT